MEKISFCYQFVFCVSLCSGGIFGGVDWHSLLQENPNKQDEMLRRWKDIAVTISRALDYE